ncbi:succinate--CoA ligase [ADP-forming] subunit beta, mitochondrial-like [Chironomus tepperi]|uniref:succinate--CoA ligase [ADP-forming] subunit beta, mitochondrial-like n=1 Tax=Chironomus tepperi TaxID=113505 RepID=UPI00391FBCC5
MYELLHLIISFSSRSPSSSSTSSLSSWNEKLNTEKYTAKDNIAANVRFLNLQEHFSQTILNDHNITTPKFKVAKSVKEAEQVAKDLLTKNLVVKAQVVTGGRGLGVFENGFQGGVHTAISPCEAKELAGKMIGNHLITKQTKQNGLICNSVMIAERKFSRREFYFAFALDREHNGPVLIASSKGGVNIEEVAARSPEAVIYEPIDITKGFTKEIATWILKRVGITDQPGPACKMLCNLYNLFVKKDALLAEINPYVEDVCMNYYPLDVKITFDDNARFRQREIFEKFDETQGDPKEIAASKLDMAYVSLDGSIGCLVNGAGLAMATADILDYHGGSPANFLDVGSMATAEHVRHAMNIIMMDEKVRTIFVNIFGGMMNCVAVTEGLLKAVRELDIKIPIVLRLQGNNHEAAKKIVKDANTNILAYEEFDEATEMAVRCSRIMKLADDGNLNVAITMKSICECEPAPIKGEVVTQK